MKPGDLVVTTGPTQLWGSNPSDVRPLMKGETLLLLELTSPFQARVLGPTGLRSTWTSRLDVA